MSAARVASPQDPYFQFHVTRDWTGTQTHHFAIWVKPTIRNMSDERSKCRDPAHPWFEVDAGTLPPAIDRPPAGRAYVCCACVGEVIE